MTVNRADGQPEAGITVPEIPQQLFFITHLVFP